MPLGVDAILEPLESGVPQFEDEPEDGTEDAGGHDHCHVDESRNRSWSGYKINQSATSSGMSDTA